MADATIEDTAGVGVAAAPNIGVNEPEREEVLIDRTAEDATRVDAGAKPDKSEKCPAGDGERGSENATVIGSESHTGGSKQLS